MAVVAMAKVSKALWLIHLMMMNQIDPPVATLAPMEPVVASGCSHGDYRGL